MCHPVFPCSVVLTNWRTSDNPERMNIEKNSLPICNQLGLAVYANSVAASVMLLLLSFAYRLWVLRAPQLENTRRHNFRRAVAQILIKILALLNMV